MTPRYPKRRDIRHRLVRTIERQRKDDIARVAESSDPVGGALISASIYDGYYAGDANPGNVVFRRDDISIDGDGFATIRQQAGDDVPPGYDGSDLPFAPYTWYDSGAFVATPGHFTAPDDGVYLVTMTMSILLTFGILRDALLQATYIPAAGGGTTPICQARVQGSLDANDADVPSLILTAADLALMTAGDTVGFDFQAHMRGLEGMATNSSILEIQRNIHYNAPPDEQVGVGPTTPFRGPQDNTRFAITKLS